MDYLILIIIGLILFDFGGMIEAVVLYWLLKTVMDGIKAIHEQRHDILRNNRPYKNW